MSAMGSLLLVMLAATAPPADDGSLFQFQAEAGPHSVGLKVIEQYDYSRTYRRSVDELGRGFTGERARPLQTLIWYPAERTGRKPMTVREYASLVATETRFGSPRMSAKSKERIAGMGPALDTSLWAVRDAPALSGHFPVIIYAPGFSGVAWENADLCEYLASHGYVVIASPDMGATSREMTYDLQGIEAQARDILFLVGYAVSLADTDASKIGIIGYSWGGISNLFASARDTRIGALVSLDGSIRYSPGLVKEAGDIHPDRMTIPLLSFAQRDFSFEDEDRELTVEEKSGPNVLNLWTHGDLVDVHLFGMVHASLSSMAQRNEDTWWELLNVRPMMQGDYGRDDAMTGYAWMARYTLRFLDAYLQHDGEAMRFLKRTPVENGVPRHVLAVSYRAHVGTPPSSDAFRAEVGRRGFGELADVYASFKQQKADFVLPEAELETWATDLIDAEHLPEAIGVLKLNMNLYPESSSAHARLADAYARAGQRQMAIDNYKASLQKDPMNAFARRRLDELGSSVEAANSGRRPFR